MFLFVCLFVCLFACVCLFVCFLYVFVCLPVFVCLFVVVYVCAELRCAALCYAVLCCALTPFPCLQFLIELECDVAFGLQEANWLLAQVNQRLTTLNSSNR